MRDRLIRSSMAFAVGCALGGFEPFGYTLLQFWLPAGRAMLAGSPYSVEGYYNPPWLVVPFLPLALLPERVAAAVYTGLELVALAYLAERWKLGPWHTGAFLLSFPAAFALINGDADPLLLALGLALADRAPWAALIVLACKPQATVGLVIWLLWRERGWVLVKTAWPTFSLFVLSLAYGPWPLLLREAPSLWWNISVYPWGLLVGVPLLWHAACEDKQLRCAAASPLLSPYLTWATWIPLVLESYRRLPAWVAWVLTLLVWLWKANVLGGV